MSRPQRGMSRGLLLFLMAVLFFLLGSLIFGGCDQPKEFYSTERECLFVEQEDSSFNCYTTHEAYGIHEGYNIEYAEDRFRALKRHAEKRAEIKRSVDSSDVYSYPFREELDWKKKELKREVIKNQK